MSHANLTSELTASGRPVSVAASEGHAAHLQSPSILAQLPCSENQVAPSVRSSTVAHEFETHPELPGVLVVDDGRLVGVVSRVQFQERLSQPFGLELFLKRPIQDLLNQLGEDYWLLPGDCEISQATRFALNRPNGRIYEPIVVEQPRGRFTLLDTHTLLLAQTHLLAQANETIQQQKDAAESANAAKSEFLANMSHEIRTPLTAILGFAENLLDGGQDEAERRSALKTILRNGEHLLGVINDILDLSKIEAGKLEIESLPVSPVQLVADVLSVMRVRADAKRLALRLRYDSPMPEVVQTDPTRLRQILINLIGNAIKFTSHGFVELRVAVAKPHSDQPQLQLVVADTGIGLSQDQIDRLFSPFTQVDGSTTRKYGGTGLGLSISRRLARMLGGDVTVASELGRGSQFTVVINTGSLHQVAWIKDPSEVELREESTRNNPIERFAEPCRILLAEDSPDNQRLISVLLERWGAEVVVAHNGQMAADLAWNEFHSGRPFDVILMDMQMPVLDGYSATRLLRSQGYREPIVALTANAMSEDRQRCLNAGCDDYAIKPIRRSELRRALERQLQREARNSSTDTTATISVKTEISETTRSSSQPPGLPEAPALLQPDVDVEPRSQVGRSPPGSDSDPATGRTPSLERPVAVFGNSEQSSEPTCDAVLDPLLTRDAAFERLNHDEALFGEISGMVRQLVPELLAEIDRSLRERDQDRLKRAAHTLKNSADNVGGQPTVEAAYQVERLAKEHAWNSLSTAVLQLHFEAVRLQAALTPHEKLVSEEQTCPRF